MNVLRKRKSGEREAARVLHKLLGETVTRNLNQVREGGHDLLGIDGWSIEVKRARVPHLCQWWVQAVSQSNGQRPCLLYRLDRQG
jgi:hypothetical protein